MIFLLISNKHFDRYIFALVKVENNKNMYDNSIVSKKQSRNHYPEFSYKFYKLCKEIFELSINSVS